MRWPYNERADPVHAWGAVATGTAGLIGIPAVLATLHSSQSSFRWWWPTGWMIIPLTVFVVGIGLLFIPVRRSPPPRAEVPPPGGAVPHRAPVEYQVNALRQIIAKISETMTEFDFTSLDAMLKNHPRTGTDPVYEPLHAINCQEGLARLTELREIEGSGWRWKIITKGRSFLTDIFGRRSQDAASRVPQHGTVAGASEMHDQEAEAPPDQDQDWQAAWDESFTEAAAEEQVEGGQQEAARGPAFTDRWQHTADGFKASPLMNMASTSMPGYTGSQERSPFVRIGVCVACEPIPSDASSSLMGARFVDFLGRDPVAGLITAMTDAGGDVAWTRLAGNGTLRFDAVLGTGDQDARPTASAMLLSPVTGMGRTDARIALLACGRISNRTGGMARRRVLDSQSGMTVCAGLSR